MNDCKTCILYNPDYNVCIISGEKVYDENGECLKKDCTEHEEP